VTGKEIACIAPLTTGQCPAWWSDRPLDDWQCGDKMKEVQKYYLVTLCE